MNPVAIRPSTLTLTLYLTAAYAVLALIGLLLAMEPSNASPIFPAAGLGLAAVLVFGRRALIGIFLGDVISSLAHAWMTSTTNEIPMTAILLMAFGSCLRAAAGSHLIQRWQQSNWQTLESEHTALAFIILGGLVSGVVAASIGVTSLLALNVIVPQEAIFSWWTWYLGDALGIMLFAPLSLCFLLAHVDVWRDRRRRLVAPMLVVFVLVGIGAWSAAQLEVESAEDRLSADGRRIARLITDHLNKHRETLASMSSYLEISSDIGFEQFERLAHHALQDNPELSALSFNEIVFDKQRTAYEIQLGNMLPIGTFQITERNPQHQLVAAGQRSMYVPVRYISPLVKNRPAVGYDVFSEPTRRQAVEHAMATGEMSITAPIELVQGSPGNIGLLEFYPIHQNVDLANTEHPKLKGFAVGVIKVDPMIKNATLGAIPAGLDIELKDLNADPQHNLLYRSDHSATNTLSVNTQAIAWSRPVTVANRKWQLTLLPSNQYQEQDSHRVAWAAGIVGLLFASLLQVLMLGMTGRSAVIGRKNKELQFLAYHDVLTGLPNRSAGRDRLTQALAESTADNSNLAVMYLDLNNFKQINDVHGHAKGDLLLKLVGQRLQSILSASDSVCRLSGDVFMLVLSHFTQAHQTTPICERILEHISKPFDLEGKQVSITASIGIALHPLSPNSDVDADILMRRADTALHEAKQSGTAGYRFFQPQMNAKAMAYIETTDALRRSLEPRNFAFELHYQPQIDLQNGRINGFEALIRWRRHDGRLALPGEFITIAEESGLIVPIGRWVLREACRQAVVWQAAGWGHCVVAVNLSVVQFLHGQVERDVEAALLDSGLDPRLLELEITESLLLQSDSTITRMLGRLKNRGIQIALDDFGTGYSSLAYLKQFKIDRLKIDRSFITDILEQESAKTIVQAMIQIAQSLKIKTIAEGIEDSKVANLLKAMACDEAQGYLYSKPLPAPEFERWMQQHQAALPPAM